MAEAIRMPLLSDTMKEGVIAEWHKKVGDKIKSDDVIAEVETDKATMEVMPYVDGTLLYIGVEKGKGIPVNGIMAIIGKPGEDFQSLLDGEKAAAPSAPAAKEETKAAPAVAAAPGAPAPVVAHIEATGDDRIKASPLAKKLAEDKGVDLSQVRGSGDNGRIIKRDVDGFQPPAAPQKKAMVMQAVAVGQEGHTDTPVSQMRKIIAQRLAESKFSAPHFYLRMTVTMDEAIKARTAINNISPVKVSFNDLIIKACAMALRQHPEVNSSWLGDVIRQNHHIHIGTAVAVEEGLIVPVVRFADQKSLSQIASEAKELADKAKNKKIQPQEFTGNTFTISNLGMMDIDEFTAIINPPDSCILAVGKIVPTPVAENGQVVVRQLLKLTLSCDHRTVDGAVGARFLQTLKAHLENPVTMLV
jgi:pyruvate dehydrogenase E2 component (dihydrolipoamide acetyltransferase)